MSDPVSDTLAVRKAREAGYTDEEIAAHLATTTPKVQQARQAGYSDNEIVDHLATAPQDNSRLHGLVLGVEKPIENLADLVTHIPGVKAVQQGVDSVGAKLGFPSTGQAEERNQLLREGNTRTGYQTAGNIVGTLPTMALKGGMAVQGAASGALLSDKHSAMGIATDAAVGGLSSLAGGAALKGVGALGKTVTNKAAVALHNAGIDLSPGQLMQATGTQFGNAVRAAEDKMRSWPLLGSLVSGSRGRASNALNHAVANDVVSSIGKKIPADVPTGHVLLDTAEEMLSKRYQQVVPHLVGHVDQQFATDLTAATAVTKVLPPGRQKQFGAIIRDVFQNRTHGNTITGQNLKDAESRLTLLAGQYSRSQDADQKILGEALFKARQALRDMAVRSDPSGSDLQGINQGWAKLMQMRKAANVNGYVTPTALARQANKSGHGKELARAASSLMPDHVPNSGSADRLLAAKLADMATGSVGGGAATAGVLTGHAGTAGLSTLAALVAAAPYTKAGARLINKIAFANKPAAVQHFGTLAQYAARGAPVAVPALLAHK